MLTLLSIFVMLAVLSLLIIVHEIGHYSVARFFGFQTPVFGFGLPVGPYWVMGHRWGTEFRVHACLLGGYVAIPELGDETNAREETYGVPLKPFRKFPIWQRALVAAAGVAFNVIFAYVVVLVMMLSIGEPAQSVGVAALPPENPIAAKAGVKVGDVIKGIDGKEIRTSSDIIAYMTEHKQQRVVLNVLRDNQQVDIPVVTNEQGRVGMVLTGVGDTEYRRVEGSFFEIAILAAERLWTLTNNMLQALGMVFQSIFAGGKPVVPGGPAVGIQDVHGVMAVVKFGMDIFEQDWRGIFLFTALISIDLAIINLVPWPALDGGHLAFMAVEAVRGRPMGERAQGEIVKWGFISLLLLMAVIMVNDVRALITGELDFKLKSRNGDAQKQEQPAPGGTLPGNSGQSSGAPEGAPGDSGQTTPVPAQP